MHTGMLKEGNVKWGISYNIEFPIHVILKTRIIFMQNMGNLKQDISVEIPKRNEKNRS